MYKYYLKHMNSGRDFSDTYELFDERPTTYELREIKQRLINKISEKEDLSMLECEKDFYFNLVEGSVEK